MISVSVSSCGKSATEPGPPPPDVEVDDPADFRMGKVSAGGSTSCAIASFDAYCWGGNFFGQGGPGLSASGGPTPARFNAGIPLAGVNVREFHGCGLTVAGDAYCWGLNNDGELGNGTFDSGPSPVAVSGGISFAQVEVGFEFTCGRSTSGDAYCWGRNPWGQLGDGTTDGAAVPSLVRGSHTFQQISVGRNHTCGLDTSGLAWCWGALPAVGAPVPTLEPASILGAPEYAWISAGDDFTCALTPEGEAYCWGYNSGGQLGSGDWSDHLNPRRVAGDWRFVQVTTGFSHTCALTVNRLSYWWGVGFLGQRGDGLTGGGPVNAPTASSGGYQYEQIAAGDAHTCGITAGGKVYCWGSNLDGQSGANLSTTSTATPTAVPGPW